MQTRTPIDPDALRQTVRSHYARAAKRASDSLDSGCCGESDCGCGPISEGLYDPSSAAEVPKGARAASLGCANPTALADLHPGEVVLDLGSGGGMDVLLSARRVGPDGFAFGLDMTDEMLALAETNRREAGLRNVAFLKGHIEQVPLPNESVDVILSNCVVNLSVDKGRVFDEAYRVLRPGGRFAVADIVAEGDLPEEVRSSLEAYAGCVAGALTLEEYEAGLRSAGFEDVSIEPLRRFGLDEDGSVGCCSDSSGDCGPGAGTKGANATLASAFVRARKPVSS